MKDFLRILTAAVIGMLFLQVITACGHGKQDKEVWTGEFSDGTIITEKGLSKILTDHRQWISKPFFSEGKAAGRANLSGAYLSSVDLCRVNLYSAKLRGANLSEADLRGADLRGADLRGANLSGANLSRAYLRWANLSGANLSWTNLRWINLIGPYLSRRASLHEFAIQLCEAKTMYKAQLDAGLKHQVEELCPDLLQERPMQERPKRTLVNNTPYGAIHLSKNVRSVGSAFLSSPSILY